MNTVKQVAHVKLGAMLSRGNQKEGIKWMLIPSSSIYLGSVQGTESVDLRVILRIVDNRMVPKYVAYEQLQGGGAKISLSDRLLKRKPACGAIAYGGLLPGIIGD